MALLAVQVGFPLIANEIFTQIRENPKHSWAEVRAEFGADEGSPEPEARHATIWPNESPQVGQREWLRLTACLGPLLAKQKLAGSLGGYNEWIKRVNRYSFRAVEHD